MSAITARELEQQMPDGRQLLSDEPEMESSLHYMQLLLLVTCLEWAWQDRDDFFIVENNQLRYFSLEGVMLPTPQESAKNEMLRATKATQIANQAMERAEQESLRAEQEAQRANQSQAELRQLQEKIRSLGISLD